MGFADDRASRLMSMEQYNTLLSWGTYLVSEGQFPTNQCVALILTADSRLTNCDRLSIDDGNVSNNSTNLALKAIFGIQAMAELSNLLGKVDDSQRFNVRQAPLLRHTCYDKLTIRWTENGRNIYECMGDNGLVVRKQNLRETDIRRSDY